VSPTVRPDLAAFAALRRVPASVEAWWVARAREATGAATDAEALEALAPHVQRLSDAFTCARPVRFEDYAKDAVARAAYGLFYFPQTWVRARFPLAEARTVRGWRPPTGRLLRVLDMGAGTGAAGLSVGTWLLGDPRVEGVEVVAVDHAPDALRALAALAAAALPPERLRVTTVAGDVRRVDRLPRSAAGPFDLVLASFVLNEAFSPDHDAEAQAWLSALASTLAPEGMLLVLEPGTKDAAERLFRLAARAVGTRLHPWGPQLHAGAWEPRADRRTWFHEVRRWEPPESLARVNRTLWRSIHELTFSYTMLGASAPAPLPASPLLHRLCSPVRRARGRLTWLGLGSDGRLAEYEVQERNLVAYERKRFLTFERGDVLKCEEVIPLGRPDAWRLPSGRSLVRHLPPEAGVP
jgi:SAM-dependent methyltransferase